MENARILELMAKKLDQSASPEELEELARLLGAHPGYGYLQEVVQSLQGNREHVELNMPARELTDQGWQHLAGRLKEEEGPEEPVAKLRRLWPRWVAAASVALVGGAAWWLHHGSQGAAPVQTSRALNVGYGDQRALTLSDGTRIRLNAGSRLVYPDRFTGTTREVTLEGEAFFDVAPQASMPFLVHTGKLTIKVLGTSFDVRDYKEDADITTTLVTGKVQVTMDNDPDRNVILAPREKLVVAKADTQTHSKSPLPGGLRYQVRYVNNLAETAWMENKLIFNDEPFEEVAMELERKYNVAVEFETDALRDEHLSGVFDKENLQQVLDILRATTRFDYRLDGKKVVLVKALK
jgi:ferric-dicitrate binding protein FerR (iron transport regulator)